MNQKTKCRRNAVAKLTRTKAKLMDVKKGPTKNINCCSRQDDADSCQLLIAAPMLARKGLA